MRKRICSRPVFLLAAAALGAILVWGFYHFRAPRRYDAATLAQLGMEELIDALQDEEPEGLGMHFSAWADDFFASDERRQCRYVVEIPRNLQGWLYDPGDTPRHPAHGVEHLCHHAVPMIRQDWTPFHIKNTNKGPMVWKVKSAPFWLYRNGQVLAGYHLIWAHDPLHPEEEKLFLVWDPLEDRLENWLHVGFGRWPVERVLEDKKSELGFSHFEVRTYQALMRHFVITMASHLFLARQTGRLWGEKSRHHAEPSPRRRPCASDLVVV